MNIFIDSMPQHVIKIGIWKVFIFDPWDVELIEFWAFNLMWGS